MPQAVRQLRSERDEDRPGRLGRRGEDGEERDVLVVVLSGGFVGGGGLVVVVVVRVLPGAMGTLLVGWGALAVDFFREVELRAEGGGALGEEGDDGAEELEDEGLVGALKETEGEAMLEGE